MTQQFAVTFGQNYRRGPHPVLGDRPDLPDGWGRVEANDYHHARWITATALGSSWSTLYELGELDSTFFPLGELFDLSLDSKDRPVILWTAPKGTS